MKLSICVLLLLSVLVLATVTPSEAGWVRNILDRIGDIKNASAIKGVVDIVRKYGPLVMRGELMAELERQCPVLFGKDRPKGLTSNDVLSAFQYTDENKDKQLSDNETSLFENTLEAVKHCLEILWKPKGN